MRILALFALCALSAIGCSSGNSRGWTARIVDINGDPIPNARVSVVPMPAGGLQGLQIAIQDNRQLWGWFFVADEKGKVSLKGVPTGGLAPESFTPGQTYTYNTNSNAQAWAYGNNGSSAYAHGQGQSRTTVTTMPQMSFRYVPGEPLGVIVTAPGYQPYVAEVILPRPSGSLGKITVYSQSKGSMELRLRGGKVTLSTW
jgi:hypothetical protein